jgi:hypothetical protein
VNEGDLHKKNAFWRAGIPKGNSFSDSDFAVQVEVNRLTAEELPKIQAYSCEVFEEETLL